MVKFRYGGKRGRAHTLTTSDQFLVVRTHSRNLLRASPLSKAGRRIVEELEPVIAFPAAGVEVLRCGTARDARTRRSRARTVLNKERDCRFAGRVLVDRKSGRPVIYTENFFVKFEDDCRPSNCKRLLRDLKLKIRRELPYTCNAYFVSAPEGTGSRVFKIAEKLLRHDSVELCHPEFVREVRRRSAFPQQWHLKKTTIDGNIIDASAHVKDAWAVSDGDGTVIAVIDDGFDLEHEEFASPGKIVAPRDVSRHNQNPRPGSGDNHGTACAGVACADGRLGASGVAFKAKLMPIRNISGLGAQDEADAFIWAAEHGADVISCSWGPSDGEWWNPSDPAHQQVVPLPDSTRLAIDWVVRNGRNGKGCVITWAAGNGNESVDNDGYASYARVIAVAACNDVGKKSAYSDYGDAIWCTFPSSHGYPSRTAGIWTTDRSGAAGYNSGRASQGDAQGNYANDFGGTSSACPGAAGVAALILARNPSLRWDEVRDIIKRSCDKIDRPGGNYGAGGHSDKYGYGRLNATKAISLALPPQPKYTAIHTAVQDVPIRNLKTSKLAIAVGDTKGIKEVRIDVNIEHTYIGDLVVCIRPPAGMGVAPVTLHNRAGGGADNLKTTYDHVNTPALDTVVGKDPQGMWTLSVEDKARRDVGMIRSVSVRLGS